MIKKAYIFGNGRLLPSFLEGMDKTALVIGVDRAAFWLIKHGVVPEAAVGDFDSTTSHELSVIRKQIPDVVEFPAEKDATDLELAVGYAVEKKMSHIIIYGGTGTRLDHVMAAVTLLETHETEGVHITLRDDYNEAFLLAGLRTVTRNPHYTYLSVLPVTESASVTMRGVKYPVVRQVFRRGSTLGVSNEINSSEATVLVHKGKVLVVRSRD